MRFSDLMVFTIASGIIFLFVIYGFDMISETDNVFNDTLFNCADNNTSSFGCIVDATDSPILSFVLSNKMILFFIFVMPLFFIFGGTFMSIIKGILSGIFDFLEMIISISSNSENTINTYDNEKEQYLKETKTKLKKELNRKSSKSYNQSESKGVQWGSGVDTGKGMDDYENEMKGGDK